MEKKLKFMKKYNTQSNSFEEASPGTYRTEIHNRAVRRQNAPFTHQLTNKIMRDNYEESDPTVTSVESQSQYDESGQKVKNPQMMTINVDLGPKGIVML